jgi:hypothetical protein
VSSIKFPSVSLIFVRLNQIEGPEKETEAFLKKIGFEVDVGLDWGRWQKSSLPCLYLLSPMLLVRRGDGYRFLGSGRASMLAHEIFGNDEEIPAFLIDSQRVARETKLQILEKDLLCLPAIYRTRNHLPDQLFKIWMAFDGEGIKSIMGSTLRDFSRATGFSLKALSNLSASKSDPGPESIVELQEGYRG